MQKDLTDGASSRKGNIQVIFQALKSNSKKSDIIAGLI